MTVKFHVLGPVTVAERTESLNIGGTKQRTVLAMLVSRAGQSLTADVLAQAVYGDDLPTRSRRLIQTYVSTLRSVVGDTIAKSGGGWSLVVDRGDVDLFRFEDLYHAAMGLGPDDASAMLSEALSMWRGDPYCDVEAHGALDGEITRLVELHTSMLQARIDADLDLGRHNAVIGELETLVVEHPYQEHFRAQHMLALYRAGRQSDALRSFSGMRQQLVDELGVDPSVELQDLERRILEHDGSLERQSEPPRQGRARAEVLSSVPIPATALVGRGVELARIQAMLSERRLVTLTGVGGCGKTRLAIEVARRMQSELEHGAYFADLSIVASDEDVVSAVVEALRLDVGGGDPLVRILEFLADKQALLVLDNCEHIIDGCAAFAEAVLGQRGDWRVLATSREVLGVAGEQVYGVPRMLTDDDEAVALFAARASDLTPDFVVDDSNRATVRELCERLDGMPLAIELAAARAAVMSPAELLDRIDDRFRILSGGRRRGRNRHRTMEATLDWSYDLLNDDEQRLFGTLGVFTTSFDASAAAAVGDVDPDVVVDLLDSLVAKSLVTATHADEITWFRLLETVRSYAEGRLQETDDLELARDRHLDHLLATVGDATAERWMRLVPNLDAAIDWAIACDRWSDAAELLTAGQPGWHNLSLSQSQLDRTELVAAALPMDGPIGERLLRTKMQIALAVSDPEPVLAAARQAMRASDEAVRHAGLWVAANVLAMTDPDESTSLAEALDHTEIAHELGTADAARAYVHMFAGEYQEALGLLGPLAGSGDFLYDVTTAALLLMDGRAADALALAQHQPLFEFGWDAFSLITGLSQLALGRRDEAEREIIAGARSAASGRIMHESNTSLVGIAALVNNDGDVDWATEIVLGAPTQRLHSIHALARTVADQIGVRDELVKRQEASFRNRPVDATSFLRQNLKRWDERTATSAVSTWTRSGTIEHSA